MNKMESAAREHKRGQQNILNGRREENLLNIYFQYIIIQLELVLLFYILDQ